MNFGIRFKVLLILIPMLVSMVAIFHLQRSSLKENYSQTQWVKEVQIPLTTAIYLLRSAFSEEFNTIFQMIGGRIDISECKETHEVYNVVINFNVDQLLQKIEKKELKEKFKKIVAERDRLIDAIFEAKEKNKNNEVSRLLLRYRALAEQMNLRIELFHEEIQKRQEEFNNEVLAKQEANLSTSLIVFFVALLLSLFLAILISYILLEPIKILQRTSKEVEGGNYDVRVPIASKDELGLLSANFNKMLDSIVQAQEQLSRSAKLSTMGEMAGGIAHEINNPLAIILATSQRLKSLFEKGLMDPEKTRMDLERIEKTSWRISKIINGLRSLSRNSENDPMEFTEVKKVVEECSAILSDKLKKTGVQLRIECEEDLWILSRPSQVFQVIMNLMSNAIDAVEMLDERWITVESRVSPQMPHRLWIQVTDAGNGISPQVLENMMTPFFTTKVSGKGTGLGLSIARKIAESHGGHLFYTLNEGHTSFVLELDRQTSIVEDGVTSKDSAS